MSLLLTLLAAKGLGALVGSLLLITQPVPGLAEPRLAVVAGSLHVQTELRHGFNRHLDGLLGSGTTVAVGYSATLLARRPDGTVEAMREHAFFHSARYEPAADSFLVFRSELAGRPDSLLTVPTLASARELLVRVNAPIGSAAGLGSENEYAVRLRAALNTVRLEALEGQDLDLNTFWNYRYPRGVTPWTRLDKP